MTSPELTPEALDAAIDELQAAHRAEADGTAGAGAAVDARTLRLLDELRALAAATPPRAGFVASLEARLLGDAAAVLPAAGAPLPVRTRPRRVLSRRRLLLAPAAALALVAVGATVWQSPTARAQVARLAAYVPGLGIRAYDPGGLAAPNPVAVTRDGATMTVKSLLSSGDTTTAQVEVTGLPASPPLAALLQQSMIGSIVLTLRDAHGKAYPPAPRRPSMASGGSGAGQSLRLEKVFVGLDPAARAVEVSLVAPPPVGDWTVRVPVAPVAQSGLPAAQEQTGSATLHGVTVGVANVAADAQRTVIQLTGQAAPPIRYVRSLGRGPFPSPRVLRDDHGRSYQEVPSPGRTFPDTGGSYTDDALFPPLPADVRAATLTIPFVIVEESGQATLTIPTVGKQVGDQIPLDTMLAFGAYPLRVTGAELIDQRGERRLLLHLDPGGWRDGRELVHPGQLLVDSKGVAFQFGDDGDVGQATQRSVALPVGADSVTLTFLDPNVAVQGPWQLPITLSAGR